MFRCVARYGYKDVRKEDNRAFEQLLVESLEKFLRIEALDLAIEAHVEEKRFDSISVGSNELSVPLLSEGIEEEPSTSNYIDMAPAEDPSLEYELAALREAMESGFTYLLGRGDMRANKKSLFI